MALLGPKRWSNVRSVPPYQAIEDGNCKMRRGSMFATIWFVTCAGYVQSHPHRIGCLGGWRRSTRPLGSREDDRKKGASQQVIRSSEDATIPKSPDPIYKQTAHDRADAKNQAHDACRPELKNDPPRPTTSPGRCLPRSRQTCSRSRIFLSGGGCVRSAQRRTDSLVTALCAPRACARARGRRRWCMGMGWLIDWFRRQRERAPMIGLGWVGLGRGRLDVRACYCRDTLHRPPRVMGEAGSHDCITCVTLAGWQTGRKLPTAREIVLACRVRVRLAR